ncbi:hypothetical protein GGI06_001724 [Coemansia sp. S85]|nr:hypothetical protein GGI06_001724 [Coemansia sp. S85]
MHTLSPLQTLPLHIVELIIDYITGSSRLYADGSFDGPERLLESLTPLLTTCPGFTAYALARIYVNYDLKLPNIFDSRRSIASTFRTCPSETGPPADLYAKRLTISVGALDVCNGDALRALSRKPFCDRTLPKVRSIKIKYSMPRELDPGYDLLVTNIINSPTAEGNISAFVQRVKQMAPVASSIGITLDFSLSSEPRLLVQPFSDLVAKLSKHAVDLEYRLDKQPVVIDLQLSGLSSLVYFSLNLTDGGKRILQLARLNAPTLRLLDICVVGIANIASLIRNADGLYVQYPYLHTFKLYQPRSRDLRRLPSFPDALPFPNLRRLLVEYEYPFGDDTVFRGNSATLESLTLRTNFEAFNTIQRFRVFTPVSHPKLQYVQVSLNPDTEPRFFDSDIDYMRFVLSIGSDVPVRVVFGAFIADGIRSVLPAFGECTGIQVLNLGYLSLTLWDAIELIKALPLLSDLRASFPVLGQLPNGVAKHKLPAHVIANYAPTGPCFRFWSHVHYGDSDIKKNVRCMLLLALVCPNFDYAAPSGIDRSLFMAHMKKMIMTDGFRPHATRLRRLLFGGPENKILNVKAVRAREQEMGIIRGH